MFVSLFLGLFNDNIELNNLNSIELTERVNMNNKQVQKALEVGCHRLPKDNILVLT